MRSAWYGDVYEKERHNLLTLWFETANLATNYYSNAELRELISDTLLNLSKQTRDAEQGRNLLIDQLPALRILRHGLWTSKKLVPAQAD